MMVESILGTSISVVKLSMIVLGVEWKAEGAAKMKTGAYTNLKM